MLISTADKFKKGGSLAGLYRGVVFDNVDPKGLGRLKIFVEGRLQATAENLPWSFPKSPAEQGGSQNSPMPKIPEIGSVLVVEFPFDDVYFPVYSGKWLSTNTAPSGFLEDYLNVSHNLDEEGNGTSINKTKQEMETKHSSGSLSRIEKDGTIRQVSKSKVRFEAEDGSTSFELDMVNGKLSVDTTRETYQKTETSTIESSTHNLNVGNLRRSISGSDEAEINGGKKTAVGGSESKTVGSHQNTIIAGNKKSTVVGETEETFGQGKSTDVVLGDVVQNLLAGNVESNLTLGDFLVNIVAGNLDLETLAGEAKFGNPLGNLEINPLGQVKITGTGGVELLDQIIQTLDDLIAQNTDLSTMIHNTAVGPTSPPVNAPLFVKHAATLTAIKLLLTAMKG